MFGKKGLIIGLQTSFGFNITIKIVSIALAAGRAEKMLSPTVVELFL